VSDDDALDAFAVGNLFGVRDKVVLVTGGSRGIGNHIARGFVVNGARTYISARNAGECEAAANELSDLGTCVAIPADVASDAGRRQLVGELRRCEPALHVLVNNAGRVWGGDFLDVAEDGFDKVMNLNVKAVFLLMQALLPDLEKSAGDGDPARVINIGSIISTRYPSAQQQNFVYPSSKAAVTAMTRQYAMSLARGRVTFNVIAPGYFDTKLARHAMSEYHDAIVAATPMGRLGAPADVAGAALFLASRAGSFINGAVLPVDGGAELGNPNSTL
jgi:NAD(P)-dependent dehydrogenase (short-subunit alcohol dehydrogenase family)